MNKEKTRGQSTVQMAVASDKKLRGGGVEKFQTGIYKGPRGYYHYGLKGGPLSLMVLPNCYQ